MAALILLSGASHVFHTKVKVGMSRGQVEEENETKVGMSRGQVEEER